MNSTTAQEQKPSRKIEEKKHTLHYVSAMLSVHNSRIILAAAAAAAAIK